MEFVAQLMDGLEIRSHLSNRKHFTVDSNIASSINTVTCGDPQGSTLHPLLFLLGLYANDMINALPREKLKLFADDTGLFISGVDISVLNHNCNCHINALNRWFIVNRLHLNVQKTNVMVLPKNNVDNICYFRSYDYCKGSYISLFGCNY